MRVLKTDYDKIVTLYKKEKLSSPEIAKIFNCSMATVLNILKRKGVLIKDPDNNRSCAKFDETFFEKITSEEKAYFLGLMYADGCVERNLRKIIINLQIRDREILDKFKEVLLFNRELRVISFKNKAYQQQVSFEVYSKKICRDLIQLGCTPKKSLTLEFPTFEQVPKEMISHFIRGYFDGDGSVTRYKGKSGCYGASASMVGSKGFIFGVYEFFKPYFKVSPPIKSKNVYVFSITGKKEFLDFYNFIYKDSSLFLKRKKERFDEYIIEIKSRKFFYVDEKIEQYNKEGNLLRVWNSIIDIKNETGFDSGYVLRCGRGIVKTAYNFIWKIKIEDDNK